MDKKLLPYLAILLCLLFASCGKATKERPLILEAATPVPTTQLPSAPTPTRPIRLPSTTATPAKTWTPTPTPIVDTYPHKQIWLRYGYFSGGHFIYEAYLGSSNFPTLVLYTDGQLIVHHNPLPIQSKMLSPDEICNLFITLESMGLSQIKTDGTGNLDDPIYENTTGLGKVSDAGGTTLHINGSVPRHYFVYDPYQDRAVKQIMDIFAFLDHYTPNNLQPYQADRLSVYVQKSRGAYLELHPDTKPLKTIPWPARATPLSQNDDRTLFLEGEAAAEVFELTGGQPIGAGVFVDQGVEYSVYGRAILPSVRRDSFYDQYEQTAPFTPAFSCKFDVFK